MELRRSKAAHSSHRNRFETITSEKDVLFFIIAVLAHKSALIMPLNYVLTTPADLSCKPSYNAASSWRVHSATLQTRLEVKYAASCSQGTGPWHWNCLRMTRPHLLHNEDYVRLIIDSQLLLLALNYVTDITTKQDWSWNYSAIKLDSRALRGASVMVVFLIASTPWIASTKRSGRGNGVDLLKTEHASRRSNWLKWILAQLLKLGAPV